MRAVVCQHGNLDVIELPDPTPSSNQVLLEVIGCGICGSDLHARHHADAEADVLAEAGYDAFMRSHQPVVLGHEFCGRVLDYAAASSRPLAVGNPVVAMPLIHHADQMHAIGLSAAAPGAYAELVVVEEALMFPVPNGLSTDVAVLTEPVAIAYHAVGRSEIEPGEAAVVIGCGPVGLAVICVLRARGVDRIVATDLSPARRALAAACGADVVLDPADGSPFDQLDDRGYTTSVSAKAFGGLSVMRHLREQPVSWDVAYRALDEAGATRAKRPVIFECAGVPGLIDHLITAAPLSSRIVVVGVCMQPDRFRPVMAINKEIDLRFVVGYTPLEFRDTLHQLAEGTIDATRLTTDTIGLDGVAEAFEMLDRPSEHAKVIINPSQTAHAPTA